MNNGWEGSAQAWIDSMGERGERGDWGRQHVLDPVMMARVANGRFGNALDVGCGEGRFCRMLKAAGIKTTGVDRGDGAGAAAGRLAAGRQSHRLHLRLRRSRLGQG